MSRGPQVLRIFRRRPQTKKGWEPLLYANTSLSYANKKLLWKDCTHCTPLSDQLLQWRCLWATALAKVAWPSGLRRWFKAPVISMAWVRIPPLPHFHLLWANFQCDSWKHQSPWSVVPNLFWCNLPFAHFGTFDSSPMELSFLPYSEPQANIDYNWNNDLYWRQYHEWDKTICFQILVLKFVNKNVW